MKKIRYMDINEHSSMHVLLDGMEPNTDPKFAV